MFGYMVKNERCSACDPIGDTETGSNPVSVAARAIRLGIRKLQTSTSQQVFMRVAAPAIRLGIRKLRQGVTITVARRGCSACDPIEDTETSAPGLQAGRHVGLQCA
jgi:hypothetical protein